jgi:glutamate-1-semialdehyde 2,1-aminomutase
MSETLGEPLLTETSSVDAVSTRTSAWAEEVIARYRRRTPTSLQAFERSRQLVPGGVPAGLGFMHPYPLYIERGESAYVWDADGNRMLDLMAGDWLLPLGHCHPAVVEATSKQLHQGTTFCSPHPTLGADYAELIASRLPSIERIRWTASGTEATMTALRLARAFTGRGKIGKMRGGYHGTHDLSLVANGRFADPDLVPRGLIPGAADSLVILPFNDPDGAATLIERHRDDLAAVIVEPIIGGSGMIPATPEFLRRLREVTERLGILLIMDEVVTFPVGPHGAQGMYDIRPDLTTLGKAIGGGLPLGAYGGRADIMDLVDPEIDPMTQMRHASTLGGIPIALAAGLAQVRELTPQVHERMNALGDRLRAGARDIAVRRAAPLQVTGTAHLFGLHWTPTEIVDFDTALTSDKGVTSLITMSLYTEGFLMFKSAIGTVTAPMTEEDVDGLLAAIDKAIVDGDLGG